MVVYLSYGIPRRDLSNKQLNLKKAIRGEQND